jgi:putative tryptophan/tyrosine transport system substrate-binding protein
MAIHIRRRELIAARGGMAARGVGARPRFTEASREGHMINHIGRREFMVSLGGAAAVWPVVARAQQRADRVRRIAWLGLGRSDEPSPYVDSLRAGLRDLGWIEGRNLTIGLFWATGREDMEAAGRELLASDPEVIVTQELMVFAMRSLKTATPVVFGFSGDPVEGKGRPRR